MIPFALVIGVGCSLLLILISEAARLLERFWWSVLPMQFGVDPFGPTWIFTILTLTGLLVGLIVWKVPGHAGPDPATISLIDEPFHASVVPGLLLAAVLMLAGGVSLGPENPIMGANIALAVFLGRRFVPRTDQAVWKTLAIAGTVGALFGTPLAVALMLSEIPGNDPKVPLWDRLVVPLIAAGAGALTTKALAGSVFSIVLPNYPGFQWVDLLSGSLIAAVAALIGLIAVYVYPWAHRLFARLGFQPLMIVIGGMLLGVLGMIGGEITLSKGLDQMRELTDRIGEDSFSGLVLIITVKLAAIVVAASCCFRGGRIFPSLFVGVAVGVAAHVLCPAIPAALAVAAGAVGMSLAITRQGWLSFFMAAILVPQFAIMSILCLCMIPAWVLTSGRPEMVVEKSEAVRH